MNACTLPAPRVVILAAGLSSRLGRQKALVRVRGTSLLRRTLELTVRFADAPIIVVVPRALARYRTEARGFSVSFAANPERASGLSSSVRRGIKAARYSPAVLLLPVDLAELQPRGIARLISRWRGDRRRLVARHVAGLGMTARGGAPLILPRWLYPRAGETSGDVGLRELAGALPPARRVFLHLPSAELDIDTPQDLRIARRRFRGMPLA
jgi:molybdenum cofactor cytidylyltransferase